MTENNENKMGSATDVTENTGMNDETITLTQTELNKRIQSETDKIRTKYSNDIKALEAKIKELTPAVKSEAEIDFEKRLAVLEAKEKKMALLNSLSAAGISQEFTDYLKNDADVEAFSKVYKSAIDNEVQQKIKSNGYVPNGHKSGESITKEDFAKMNMGEKEQLFAENPELYRTLVGR